MVITVSIYDNREEPAYRGNSWELEYSNNPHILKWWSPAHDELLARQMNEEQWHWYWGITDKILAITPPETVEAWKAEDPLCRRWAWYNILMNFAGARADKLGLTEAIRKPEWKICPLCNHPFVEDSLPGPLTERLGFDNLDFCAPCLSTRCLQGTGSDDLSREETLDYLRELANAL